MLGSILLFYTKELVKTLNLKIVSCSALLRSVNGHVKMTYSEYLKLFFDCQIFQVQDVSSMVSTFLIFKNTVLACTILAEFLDYFHAIYPDRI